MTSATWSDPHVETVAPGVHRAQVPLPEDGLRAINVYVIEDGHGVTLVDAGWDSPLAREAVRRGLEVAGAEVGDITRMLITHAHYDHLGQATALRRDGAKSYWLGVGEKPSFDAVTERPVPTRMKQLEDLRRHGAHGLADAGTPAALASESPGWGRPDLWATEGDRSAVEDGHLEVIDTPGHTAGHQCYLHRGRRLLFAGDHVLPRITPSIGVEGVRSRLALAHFLTSLAKVRNLDVDLVLPAHGPVFSDLPARVDELLEHHDARLRACRAAVGGRPTNAYLVAAQLPWTRRQTPFAELDRFNQILATMETAAHLELLHARGEVTRSESDDAVTFSRPWS